MGMEVDYVYYKRIRIKLIYKGFMKRFIILVIVM